MPTNFGDVTLAVADEVSSMGTTDPRVDEYIEWVTEAKAEATRKKRLQISVEWRAKGRARNWKYVAT